MTSRKSHQILPIFITVFLDLIGLGMVIPIAAPLLLSVNEGMLPQSYGVSERSIYLGFLLGSYAIAQFFGAPILGALADRHGRKKMLLISITGTLIGYVLFAVGIITRNIWLCFGSRVLDGFTGGNVSIATSAMADVSDEDSKAKNFGLIGMSFGLGFILGPFIGGKLADPHLISWFTFATPYWFAAILSFINIFLIIFFFKETLRTRNHDEIKPFTGFRNVKVAFSNNQLRIIFAVLFLTVFGFNFFTQFFQVFLIQKFHFDQSDIADMFAYTGLWLAFSQGVIIRPLSKKLSSSQMVNYSLILMALALPLLLLPDKAWGLYLLIPLIAVFNGLNTPNLTTLISDQAGPEEQGSVLGIRQSVQSIAMAVPPIIAGFMTSLSASAPVLSGAFFTFAAWLVFVFFFRKRKKTPSTATMEEAAI